MRDCVLLPGHRVVGWGWRAGTGSFGEVWHGGGKKREQMCQVCVFQDALKLNCSVKILLLRGAKWTPQMSWYGGGGEQTDSISDMGVPQSVRPHSAQRDDEKRPQWMGQEWKRLRKIQAHLHISLQRGVRGAGRGEVIQPRSH